MNPYAPPSTAVSITEKTKSISFGAWKFFGTLIAGAQKDVLDEIRHAELCFSLKRVRRCDVPAINALEAAEYASTRDDLVRRVEALVHTARLHAA